MYEYDGQYIKMFHRTRLYQIDGQYIKDYQTGQRLYEYDGTYVKKYSTGQRMLRFDGNYVKDYSTGQRLLQFDGNYVKISTGARLVESTGIIPKVLVALLVLNIAGPDHSMTPIL